MKLANVKGTRDFPPEEKILRDQIVNTLKEVFELYGFYPLDTPIIEPYELLSAKCGAGEESDAMKETYCFTDQGKRKLGLRFELTLSTARFVAMNPDLKMPFKRYQIGDVFRDGPIKLGRYREFTQCDVDIFGTKSVLADAECISLALCALKKLGFDAYIELNNRKLLNGLIEQAGISKAKAEGIIIIID
ncbi:MAG: ATP phosphoribosyltransferase regulatory subunit, partial [Candidatus Woesearchaeota archaeon]